MRFFGAVCFVLGCAAASGSHVDNSKLISRQQAVPVNHWVAKPIAKDAFPAANAVSIRGGELDLKVHKTLWAALCFNTVGALCAAIKPDLICAHLMTSGGDVSEWCGHFLAISWIGAACHTFLSLQDGTPNALKISQKVNIVTVGLACLLGVWQYSQGAYDHQHALGFVAVTGVIAGALIKMHCDGKC